MTITSAPVRPYSLTHSIAHLYGRPRMRRVETNSVEEQRQARAQHDRYSNDDKERESDCRGGERSVSEDQDAYEADTDDDRGDEERHTDLIEDQFDVAVRRDGARREAADYENRRL